MSDLYVSTDERRALIAHARQTIVYAELTINQQKRILEKLIKAVPVGIGPGVTHMSPVSSKLPKVVFIIGHSAKSAGAHSPRLDESEYAFNSKVTNEIMKAFHSAGAIQFPFIPIILNRDNTTIRATYGDAKQHNPVAVIELHFNSFGSTSAHGMEVLISKNASNATARLSTFILEDLDRAYGFRNRGTKRMGLGNRGSTSVSALPHIPSVLVEPFFGSNYADCQLIEDRGGAKGLAESYIRAVARFINYITKDGEVTHD